MYYLPRTALAALYMVPLVWILSTSFRTGANLFDPSQWLPHPATTQHYERLFSLLPDLGRYAFNTLRIAVLATAGTLLTSSMAGYALARLRFPGRFALFVLILVTLMIPAQVTLIPTYIIVRELGWINTPWSIVVPAALGSAYNTFFFRQFFLAIPRELEEAAFIDGAGYYRVYWSIILPLAKPAFWTLGLLTFVGHWNGFFAPAVFLQTQDQWVLTQALQSLLGTANQRWGEIMAGVVLMSLPMFVVFLWLQRYIVQGVAVGSLKE
ncbi:MAG: carbohydrate ABC transporter permease [Thermomicrobiales bacterium]